MRAWIVLGAALLASACNQPAPTYAPEVEFNFMRACEERSEVPGLCACIWERIAAEVEPNDFIALEQLPGPAREAHALTARLTDGVPFPYLMLLVSGGHSQFVLVRGVGDYERWGSTIDDALGEAFDKVAKLLDLGSPGGPHVEKQALLGDPKRFRFPRPLLKEKTLDFSFSGLKTAVRLAAEEIAPLSDTDVADICAGFQAAVAEIVRVRAGQALERFGDGGTLVVAGGVAANKAIGAALQQAADAAGARLVIPPMALCTDNGAMVAWAGAERLALGSVDGMAFAARPRWPLDSADMGLTHGH